MPGTDPQVPMRATALAGTAASLLTAAAATAAAPTPLPTAVISTATLTPAPTATATRAAPTSTPTVSPTPCFHDADFVLDLSIPDGTHLAPGASFVKTWRLLNSGTCAWTTGYEFRLVEGDAMRGQTMTLPALVLPGERIDLSLRLVAPAAPGTYRGHWQIFTPEGEGFGIRPFVEIVVP